MSIRHPWRLTPEEAIRLQLELADRLVLSWDDRVVSSVGGIDVSVKGERCRAVLVVLHFPDPIPIEAAVAQADADFPYIPWLLSFRNAPTILAAWRKLKPNPDVLLFDGQGIAHPVRIGLAAHLGLWLDRPSLGVAKSKLYGVHQQPGLNKGHLVDPKDSGRILGSVVRTRTGVKPAFVSPGHPIDSEKAVEFTLACCTRFRLPETTRWAHRVAGGGVLPQEHTTSNTHSTSDAD